MNSPRALAPVLLPLLGLGLGLAVGCTAINTPSDGVERCENVDNCDAPADERFDPQCIKEDNDIPGVCVAIIREDVRCGEDANIYMDTPFRMAFDENGSVGRYTSGCEMAEFQGKMGCPPAAGMANCEGDLVKNELGVCDDTDPDTPMAVPASPDYVGQDIRDQHCRSFFCDMDFVCDGTNPANPICKPCNPDKPYGQGGCGSLYINNQPSCVYLPAEQVVEGGSACDAPDGDFLDTQFGTCM